MIFNTKFQISYSPAVIQSYVGFPVLVYCICIFCSSTYLSRLVQGFTEFLWRLSRILLRPSFFYDRQEEKP